MGSRKLPVLINSDGGSVDDSLAIARLIRAKGLDVAVAATVIKPCTAGDPACAGGKSAPPPTALPTSRQARCASACAFILAGGVNRYASLRTPVGVHQFRSFQTTAQILQKYRIYTRPTWTGPQEVRRVLVSEKRVNERVVETRTPDSAYKDVARFFTEMGIGNAIMPIVKTTPSSTMRWLTRTELATTGMTTDTIDGEELILGRRDAAAASMPPGAVISPPAETPLEPSCSFGGQPVPCGTVMSVPQAAAPAPGSRTP
jgi:hypothetical protein